MDFRGKKQVIINGKAKSKLFYEDRLIWSKLYGEFSKDFKNLGEGEEFFGNYDSQKGCLLVSDKFNRLAPIIEFEGSNHAKVEYGENFEMPRVKAFTISGEIITPIVKIYSDGVKIDKVDTKKSGTYEIIYLVEYGGYRTQKSYFIEVSYPKYRYIRDSIMRSTDGGSPYFRQIKIFDINGANIALNKPVTSVGPIWSGDVKTIVDGDPFNGMLDIDGRFLKEPASLTVDLQGVYEIKEISIWHQEGEIYPEAKVEASVDGKNWVTIYDAKLQGQFTEPREGRTYQLG